MDLYALLTLIISSTLGVTPNFGISFAENHRTQTKFNDALIFKLFAFQFVNSYASCFYIAFFRGVSFDLHTHLCVLFVPDWVNLKVAGLSVSHLYLTVFCHAL